MIKVIILIDIFAYNNFKTNIMDSATLYILTLAVLIIGSTIVYFQVANDKAKESN